MTILKNLSGLWNEFLDLIFPPEQSCPLCGAQNARASICQHCREIIESFRQQPRCVRCGHFQMPDNMFQTPLCFDCSTRERYFSMARSIGPYQSPLKEAIYRLKFGRRYSVAQPIGELLAEIIQDFPCFKNEKKKIAGLVPVPMTQRRLTERGFNQAELLARQTAKALGLQFLPVLVKIRDTPPQTSLPKEQRESNLSGAFAISNRKNLAGQTVILVDDVFTTGSTASECARVLLSAGIHEVYVVTVASGRG